MGGTVHVECAQYFVLYCAIEVIIMFLVKCSCGCMYTLQDKNLNYPRPGSSRHCPNCAMRHEFTTCPHTRFAGQKNNLYNGKG